MGGLEPKPHFLPSEFVFVAFRGGPDRSAPIAAGLRSLSSMIRKSGYRFSEKIMLKQKDRARC
jgi:hypothetical protein